MLIWDKMTWLGFKYGPNMYWEAVPAKICCMANFDPNGVQWSKYEMVLREATEYLFCNNFANIRNTGLKFLHSMDTYSGHLWYEFQLYATSIVGVTTLFVCFWKCTKFAHRQPQWTHWGTIGWEIWNLTVDTCFGGRCTK